MRQLAPHSCLPEAGFPSFPNVTRRTARSGADGLRRGTTRRNGMQHPTHDILAAKPAMTRQRAIGVGLVAVLHVVFVWALVNGLATKIVTAIPKELKAQVIAPTKQEQASVPPPPTMVVPK